QGARRKPSRICFLLPGHESNRGTSGPTRSPLAENPSSTRACTHLARGTGRRAGAGTAPPCPPPSAFCSRKENDIVKKTLALALGGLMLAGGATSALAQDAPAPGAAPQADAASAAISDADIQAYASV